MRAATDLEAFALRKAAARVWVDGEGHRITEAEWHRLQGRQWVDEHGRPCTEAEFGARKAAARARLAALRATDAATYVAPIPADISPAALQARQRFALMTPAEIEQDIRDRAAVIRRERKAARKITPGAEQAMRKMLTEELGMQRVRYSTIVTLHRILARLEEVPNAPISQYDESLGDERTIRSLQHVLADAGYLTQAPKFYGNGKATLQAFKGTGKERQRVRFIRSEHYGDGLAEFLAYGRDTEGEAPAPAIPADITDADVPY